MILENITELGVGGIFAIMVLYLVFTFLSRWKGKNGKKNGVVTTVNPPEYPLKDVIWETHNKVENLEKMHDVKDHKGTYVWYTGDLVEESKKQTRLLEKILKKL